MAYQIIHAIPRFNSHDAICGWRYERYQNSYQTVELPLKICSIRNDGLGEDHWMVVTANGNPNSDQIFNAEHAKWVEMGKPAKKTCEKTHDPYGIPF